MSISFTDGVEGVKARDYSVFIREAEYELDGVMVDCPAVINIPYENSLNFLTGFNLDIEKTITETKTISESYFNIGILISVTGSDIDVNFSGSAFGFKYLFVKIEQEDITKKVTFNLGSSVFADMVAGYYCFKPAFMNWSLEQVGFNSIGVMTKDSINPKIEDGLSVDLNISGTKVLDKTATFSFSLMNLVVDNILQLEALDKKKVEFLLLSSDKEQLYIFKPIVFNYSEDFKSGQVSTLPITLIKKIIDVEDFREVQYVSNLS